MSFCFLGIWSMQCYGLFFYRKTASTKPHEFVVIPDACKCRERGDGFTHSKTLKGRKEERKKQYHGWSPLSYFNQLRLTCCSTRGSKRLLRFEILVRKDTFCVYWLTRVFHLSTKIYRVNLTNIVSALCIALSLYLGIPFCNRKIVL